MRVLLIEDEKEIANLILAGLRAEHFAVDWARTGEQGLAWAKHTGYDLGIFDVRLPLMNGIEVCRTIRARGMHFPIIVLSVMSDAITKVEALNIGADDYLTKPFFMAELSARARALLRRERRVTGPILAVGGVTLNVTLHAVARAGKPIRLNRKEFSLLEYFMRNPGITLTRAMILEHVWDMNADPFNNTVDVHVRFLRQKIDDGHRKKLLKTVHGYGYKIEA
jgi:DNA-binding response OmpR family regulator